MSLSSVGVQHADLPGLVDEPYRPQQSIAIGLQHPPPNYAANTPPHHQQLWAQHVSTLHQNHHNHHNHHQLPPQTPPHLRHFPLPPQPLNSTQQQQQQQQPASAVQGGRPSPFLLSLRVGDEVDALDEIGYRQWRHAFVMELGHIPGQTVDDSGQVGDYKIRWAGWDAKWDEVTS